MTEATVAYWSVWWNEGARSKQARLDRHLSGWPALACSGRPRHAKHDGLA